MYFKVLKIDFNLTKIANLVSYRRYLCEFIENFLIMSKKIDRYTQN